MTQPAQYIKQQKLDLYAKTLALLEKVADLANKQISQFESMEELNTEYPELLNTICRVSQCIQNFLIIDIMKEGIEDGANMARELYENHGTLVGNTY